MSRIGRIPVTIPDTVKVSVNGPAVLVEGPKGKLDWSLPAPITARIENKSVVLTCSGEGKREKALFGLSRSLVNNMVVGVSKGFSLKLEIHGVGFKSSLQGTKLNLNLGFSHPVVYELPAGITLTITDPSGKKVPEGTHILIEGADKRVVGQVAADIRRYYPPEPYKGKGVRFAGEQIIRKEGKTAQSK